MRTRAQVQEKLQVGGLVFWLYMYFCIDFFLHLSARIPGYGSLRPTLVVVLLLTIMLFMQSKRLRSFKEEPAFAAILALLGYLVISLPLVEWPGSVINNNLPTFVKAIVFLFFTAYIVDTRERLKIFVFVFVSCQIFRVFEPLFLHVTTGYWGSATYIGDGEFAGRLGGAPSDIINPNELGFVIVTIVPYIHYLMFSRGKLLSIIYFMILAALLYALILTMSRGAMIALLVVGFMVFRKSDQKILLVLAMIGIMIAAWASMTDLQKDRYMSLVSSDTVGAATLQGRMRGAMNELKLALERPIVGHGLGTTKEAKYNSYGGTHASHNMYAELVIEIGLIGAILFFRYMIRIWKNIVAVGDRLRKTETPEDDYFYRLNLALQAVFWMFVVYSINYYGLSVYYWYLLGGLLLTYSRLMGVSLAEQEPTRKRAAV